MKVSSTLLTAALVAVPCAALTNNPWTTCVHPQDVKCDIVDDGPTLDDATAMREFWAKKSNEIAKKDDGGTKDADPKKTDPTEWGKPATQGEASAYGDGCSTWTDGGAHDSAVKVCQKHADGNFGNVKSVPYVCFSNYMDVLMNECKDKGKEGTVSGQLWIDKWQTHFKITTK